MPAKDLIIDPNALDVNHVVADIHEIRRINLQRHEMEQLTAIIHLDKDRNLAVGYREVTDKEFWCRGHMPRFPLMPGVIMCEVAAQLASFIAIKFDLLGAKVLGFGGLDDVAFRGPVVPGDKLVMAVEMIRVRRGAMVVGRFQGFVRGSLVVEGKIKGIPLPLDDPYFEPS